MALTNIDIANQALVKLGAQPIANLSESTAEAQTVSVFLEPLVNALLSAHPWGFATTQIDLEEAETSPLADYDYAYDLPSNFLRVISAGTQGKGAGLSYRIQQNRLHTNADSVILTYVFKPDYTDWPAFFDYVLVTRLAAELCIPLTENTSRTEALFRLADDEFKRAKLIDAQQDTPVALKEFSLIDARQ